jgi:uncharacterized protein (DUF305 family)
MHAKRAVMVPPLSRYWDQLSLALALAALVVGAFALGRLTASLTPGEQSTEAGFARDMSTHHAQAVAMADIMRERSQDPEIRTLALDIATTQQHQIGQMRGWLDMWGLSPNGEDAPMAWMGHPAARGAMPGMATLAQLRRLEQAPVAEAEEQLLRLMIHHHQAGVEMAQAALQRTRAGVVVDLAGSIASSQQAEIGLMQSMLQARGLPPEGDTGRSTHVP